MRISYSDLSFKIYPETSEEKIGLYVHFPFCSSKCPYCHFFNLPFREEEKQIWLEALVEEVKRTARIFNRFVIIETLYFGGGTPSILSPEEITRIIKEIKSCFNYDLREVTLECNPEAPADRLSGWKEAGITRLSLGLQSMDDNVIKILGRKHTVDQGLWFLEKARETGFASVNCDFMTGIPGETDLTLTLNLEVIEQLKPQHVSVYLLEELDSVPFRIIWDKNPVTEDQMAERFETYARALKNHGYEHYEISNYALPGFQCLHNLKYWQYGSFLGIGPAAASHMSNVRWQNISDLGKWSSALKEGYLEVEEFLVLEKEQMLRERIAFSLRLKAGLNWHQLKLDFSDLDFSVFEQRIEEMVSGGELESSGHLIYIPEEKFIISNAIISRLIF